MKEFYFILKVKNFWLKNLDIQEIYQWEERQQLIVDQLLVRMLGECPLCLQELTLLQQ